MPYEFTETGRRMQAEVKRFMDEAIYPAEEVYIDPGTSPGSRAPFGRSGVGR